jgi:hypothetical protein
MDIRSVVVPPWEYMVTRNFEQGKGHKSEDHLVWGLNFFVKQLLAGNPQFLEVLFSPQVLVKTEIGEHLLASRSMFVSKRFYKRLTGFAYSEFRKARMVEVEHSERTKTEDEIVNDIRNVFGPGFGEQQKEKMDDVLSVLFSCHERKEVPSAHKVNGKRKVELEKYGYGTSSACHSIRLVRQCTELLKTGNMTFPRPDAIQLSDIKHGRISLPDVEVLYTDALKEAEEAVKLSVLPERPDEGRIRAWWEKLVAKALLDDPRVKEAAQS